MNEKYSLAQLSDIAQQVISSANSKILLFYGEMGVGKTTLIKEICATLGTDDVTSSPTFSLVNEYHTHTGEIVYHFDFYRIEDYFYSDAWCLIEWPKNIQNLLPLNATEVHLTQLSDGQRNIQLKPSV